MKIELKRVEHAEFASEETECFNANLYVDGKKIATCDNQGYGGPTNVHYERKHADVIAKFKAHVAQLPRIESKSMILKDPKDPTKPFSYAQTDDSVVDELLEKWLETKWLKKLCRGKMICRFVDTPDDQWEQLKGGKFTAERAVNVRARYGDKLVEILNERFIKN